METMINANGATTRKCFYFVETLENGTEMWMDELWARNNPNKVGTYRYYNIPNEELDFSNGLIYQPPVVDRCGNEELRQPGYIVSFIW